MKNLREETLRSRPLDNRPTHRKVLERSSHWRMQIKGEVVLGWWEIPWAGESAKDMDPHTPWWRAAPLFRTNSQYFLKMVTTDYNMIATLLICNWEKWKLTPTQNFLASAHSNILHKSPNVRQWPLGKWCVCRMEYHSFRKEMMYYC